MGKVSLMFYKKECMGCHACEVACKQEHLLGVGPRLVRVIERAPHYTPVFCHHCTKAPCLQSCPTEAIYRNDRGLVLINEAQCIGCRECQQACPFGAMQFDEESEVAVKCDLCVDRLKQGLAPACSLVCSTGCIVWGEGRELAEKVLPVR